MIGRSNDIRWRPLTHLYFIYLGSVMDIQVGTDHEVKSRKMRLSDHAKEHLDLKELLDLLLLNSNVKSV